MSAPKLEYFAARDGEKFFVIDSNLELVGVFDTEDQIREVITREQREDAIWEPTKELMRHAVITIMAEFDLGQDTALYWVNPASGMHRASHSRWRGRHHRGAGCDTHLRAQKHVRLARSCQ